MAKLKEPTTVGSEEIKTYAQSTMGGVRDITNQHHADLLEQTNILSTQFVENSAEVDEQKGQRESFQDVFDTWTRFSHGGGDQGSSRPANSSELSAWQYNSTDDQVVCTQNTASLVGFVSPETFDQYVFDVILNSSDGDDDLIGLVAAYVEDTNGDGHTLVVHQDQGGLSLSDTFRVSVNPADGAWGRDTPFPYLSVATRGGFNIGGSWSSHGPVRIQVERDGSNFTVRSTDFGDTTDNWISTISFTLNDHAELDRFKGPCSVGYCAWSQDQSTFETLSRPTKLADIYDVENDVVWTYDQDQGQWVTKAPDENLKPLRFYWNSKHSRLYLTDPDNVVYRIAQYQDIP